MPDIDASLEKAASLDGRTVVPRTKTEMVTFALLADVEGHVVGLAGG